MRRLGQPPIDKECLDDTWVLSGHIVFDNFTYCEVFWWVHIVTRKHLRDAMERYPDAANEIKAWVGIVEAVRWHNFAEVHDMFKGRLCGWLRDLQHQTEPVQAYHRRPLFKDDG
jgi:hypothetical protein